MNHNNEEDSDPSSWQPLTTKTPNFHIEKAHITNALISKAWRASFSGGVQVMAIIDELVTSQENSVLKLSLTASGDGRTQTSQACVIYDGVFNHKSLTWVDEILVTCTQHLDDEERLGIASLMTAGVLNLAKPYILTKLLHQAFEKSALTVPQIDVLSAVLDDGHYLNEYMNRLPRDKINEENGQSYCQFLHGFLVKKHQQMIWI